MLANDTDPTPRHPDRHRGHPARPTARVAITGDGTGAPTPRTPNFTGTDTFTYTVTDGAGGTDTATVTITVTAVNDAPIADDDFADDRAEDTATFRSI